jgi:hypothetical protein
MKTAVVQSVCECQARLGAELDEQRRALHGWARLRGRELSAPANTLKSTAESFNVGWACPFCTRNTLRAFDAGVLVFQEKPTPSVAPPGARPLTRSSAPGQ